MNTSGRNHDASVSIQEEQPSIFVERRD
jgi:hypothetical protein